MYSVPLRPIGEQNRGIMKREIKFRAWDKIKKRMYLDIQLQYSEGKWLALPYGSHAEPLESFDLMQYTGLKDKNGKEIYEGNILNWGRHIGNKKPLNEIVQWYQKDGFCGFRLKSTKDDTYMPINPFNLKLEVIGNIYENESLLSK